MYMMGLRWTIWKMLSAQSFCSLTDLVLFVIHVEQLMEREKIMLRRPHNVLDTSREIL